jgi:hypothetical protein
MRRSPRTYPRDVPLPRAGGARGGSCVSHCAKVRSRTREFVVFAEAVMLLRCHRRSPLPSISSSWIGLDRNNKLTTQEPYKLKLTTFFGSSISLLSFPFPSCFSGGHDLYFFYLPRLVDPYLTTDDPHANHSSKCFRPLMHTHDALHIHISCLPTPLPSSPVHQGYSAPSHPCDLCPSVYAYAYITLFPF